MSYPPQPPASPQLPTHPQFPTRALSQRRKQQSLVLPIIFVVLGSLGTLIGMLVVLERPPLMSFVAVATFTVVLLLGVWFLHWLDRWEPEPPLFVLAAFLWGAGVSALISGIVNSIALIITEDMSLVAMYSAPLIEESTKGMFLVIVLLTTRRGRAEFNSLTDAIVYGGMVGLGFAWVEHISYALMPETMSESLQIVVVRLILTAYLHPMLTIIVSVGLWAGVNARGAMRFGYPFLGWCTAVVLHFLHNGSTEVFGDNGLLIVAGMELLLFIGLIVLGVHARREERRRVERQLPALVHFGWITPLEAGWLANLEARKRMIKAAGPERGLLRDFIQNTTELALLRARLDADRTGQPPVELLQLHAELVDLVVLQRAEVQRVLSGASGWTPMQGHPGQQWAPPVSAPAAPRRQQW